RGGGRGMGRGGAATRGTGRHGEVAVQDRGFPRREGALGEDALVHVQLCHSGVEIGSGPRVAGFGRAHALAQHGDLVLVLPSSLVGNRFDQTWAERIGQRIMDSAAICFEGAVKGEATRALTGGLAVVPGDNFPLIDVRCLHGVRQPAVVIDSRATVRADYEQSAKVGAEAKRIDIEVSQVTQVNRVGKNQRWDIHDSAECGPKSRASSTTAVGSQHRSPPSGYFRRLRRPCVVAYAAAAVMLIVTGSGVTSDDESARSTRGAHPPDV